MLYEVDVNGRSRTIHVHRTGGRFEVNLDGRAWTVDAVRVDAHMWSLLVEQVRLPPAPPSGLRKPDTTTAPSDGASALKRTVGASYEVHFGSQASGQLAVQVGSAPLTAIINAGRRFDRKEEGGASRSAPQRIVAPMPGKVVRVLVHPGDSVRARQPVVVIEAMKMENELRAGRDGTVSDVPARQGQSVEAGALLALIV